jgi:hypothetical protein
MSAPLAFLDVETTHLSAEIGEVWEVAVILRDADGTQAEHVWQFRPLDLGAANPESLKIGRFWDRFAVEDGHEAAYTARDRISPTTRAQAVEHLTKTLRGATIVGSNPGFDDRFLRKLLGLGSQQWNYRPTCIANLAEGYLWHADPAWTAEQAAKGPIPSRTLSRRLGVEPPGDDAHQALADARWAMAVYDAVTTPRIVRAWADDEVVTCSNSRCPNGERYANATDRGWTRDRLNNWLCHQHPIGGAA